MSDVRGCKRVWASVWVTVSENVSDCERECEWLWASVWVAVSVNVSDCERECEWLQVRVRKNKTVLKLKEQKNKLSGPKPNRSFSLASFFCFFSAYVPLMFRHVLPMFFLFFVLLFNLFRFFSFPLLFFSSLFLGVQIMWRPRFSASSNMRSQKNVESNFASNALVMMVNALCSLWLFMFEHRTVLFVSFSP